MYPTLHMLICTKDAATEITLSSFADNHPDISGFHSVDSWEAAHDAASAYEVLFLDAGMIHSPDALRRIPDGTSVILLADEPNDCRRFKGTRISSCLIKPILWESFQWTIRSVQPMYAEEMA